jgi:hypothetical protein
MQAPKLKVLALSCAWMSIEETKHAILDVQNGMILQNLEVFEFTPYFNFDVTGYSDSLVRTLLKCCVAYCPKLCQRLP